MSEWVEHDGMGYPVPIGTRVNYKYADGEEGEVVIKGRADASGFRRENGNVKWSPWFWRKLAHMSSTLKNYEKRIIAYRIVDDGAEAETKRREARMDTFRKMADAVSPIAPDPKLPAPKKRERV